MGHAEVPTRHITSNLPVGIAVHHELRNGGIFVTGNRQIIRQILDEFAELPLDIQREVYDLLEARCLASNTDNSADSRNCESSAFDSSN